MTRDIRTKCADLFDKWVESERFGVFLYGKFVILGQLGVEFAIFALFR